MDIEFDFKGDPLGGIITHCEYRMRITCLAQFLFKFDSCFVSHKDGATYKRVCY